MPKAIPANARLVLRLYIAGNAPNSVLATANIRAICDEHYALQHEIEIVDLLKFPQRALADGVIATPMLLRLSPVPIQRVIGNLSDTARVLQALNNK